METFAIFDWCNFMISTGRLLSNIVAKTNPQFNDELECQEIKCDGDHDKSLLFIDVKKLSKPLVTAEEDGFLWFLDSGKLPFHMLSDLS
ncbi:hypothetical protein CI610_03787 [invertebrate metagenome]|uniref:Uncharacterized protein n=1 Tax=invertebrate metagenome TaxID=1711999 RepID=A0A2H9T243_9ZZZZ